MTDERRLSVALVGLFVLAVGFRVAGAVDVVKGWPLWAGFFGASLVWLAAFTVLQARSEGCSVGDLLRRTMARRPDRSAGSPD